MITLVFGGVHATKWKGAYESLSYHARTNPAVNEMIKIFWSYCADTIQDIIQMMNGYLSRV